MVTSCIFDGNDTTYSGIQTANSSILSVFDSYFTGHTNFSIYPSSSTTLIISDTDFIDTASNAAIYSSGGLTNISNCTIQNDGEYGIYCGGNDINIVDCSLSNTDLGLFFYGTGHMDVFHCEINGCTYGITNYGSGTDTIHIERCFVHNNDDYGIFLQNSNGATIINNCIYDNDDDGLYLDNNSSAPEIRNNTICKNGTGIYFDSGTEPNITNCILWDNDTGLSDCSASYSCIEDGGTENNNINSDPCFYGLSVNDYHLKGDSPCIDEGTGTYNSETDFDGENRVMDGDYNGTKVVDRGADEFYWPKADYDENWIVNFFDFSEFAIN